MRDYAEIWRAADKIVYSSTLEQVASARTRIERRFDPEAVRELKRTADRDLAIGGPGSPRGLRRGPGRRVQLFLSPVIVGGGTRALPDGVRSTSSWWTSAASPTASSTCATALQS